VNGAPGVGKSALADRYGRDHALALVVDVDDLRRHLGRWETIEESKTTARDLAVALAAAHLGRGFDVVIPQYVGRREFVARLHRVAADAGTAFVEVLVTDDDAAIVERFRARRAMLANAGVRHPEADLADADVDASIRAAAEALRRDAAAYDVAVVDGGAGIEAAYRALCDVLARIASA